MNNYPQPFGVNRFRAARAAALALLVSGSFAQAQSPADPYSHTRTSSFTYKANGLLETETIEPNQPQLCVTTTYTYDSVYGNKTGATTANCAGATGLNLVDSRSSSNAFTSQTGFLGSTAGASVPVPAGAFATSALNALNQSESRVYDPRFGAVVKLTGPNLLDTTWTLDDFGRKVLETRADGTKTAAYFCWLKVYNSATGAMDAATAGNALSNSPSCHNGISPNPALVPAPAANEAPADAVRYEHTLSLNAAGTAAIGPFSRVYYDRAGRKLRSVTEGFDGAGQPGGAGRLIVQDTDYNAYGTAILSTQPYFLATTSSTTGGSANYGMTLTEYDTLGRPKASYTTDPATTQQTGGSVPSMAFGSRGTWRATQTTVTYIGTVTVTTDDKGRTRKEEKNPDGKVMRVTDATGTDPDTGAQTVHQHDAFGNLVATKDPLGNQINIVYDIRGRKVRQVDPDAGVTAYCYDALGQLKAQQTSNQRGSHGASVCPTNSGLGTTAPVVAGWTTLAYDVLGRMTSRAEPEYVSTWVYDSCTKGVGKLCQTSTSNGITKKLVYDGLGRPINSRTDVSGGPSMATSISYDANGRVATQRYPTGVQVSYQYTAARGFLQAVRLDTAATVAPLPSTPGGTPAAGTAMAAGTLLWQAMAVNAWGKVEEQKYANGINNRAVFEPQSGRLTNLTAGPTTTSSVVDQRYSWDSLGQLTQRIDAIGDASGTQVLDTFQYDKLGRLTQYQVSGNATPIQRTVGLQYNALGMLLSKTDVGNYSYPAQGVANGRPHAVQSIAGINVAYTYDLNGNAITANGGKWRSIAYTSFNLPDGTNGIQAAGGNPKTTWQYDENHQRIKEVRVNSSGTRTTWNLHPDNQGGLGFEREIAPSGAASNRHYLSAGGAAFAVLVTTGNLPTLAAGDTQPAQLGTVVAAKIEYWHKDQLGSLIATTDHGGAVTARYAYDPFGKRRYTNSSYDAFGNLVIDWTTDTNKGDDRGFTGHEHLDDLGLIHMNGRVFDASIVRFVQADPLISEPLNLQAYDRYGYCGSNPLICTDPTGHSWLSKAWKKVWNNKIVRTVIIAVASYYTAGYATELYAASAGTAAASAAASSGYMASTMAATSASAAAASSVTAGVIGGAVGGFTASFIVSNGNLRAGFKGAVNGAIFGGIAGSYGSTWNAERIVVTSSATGLISVANGGQFADGFRDGLRSSLLSLSVSLAGEATDSLKRVSCQTSPEESFCKSNRWGELLTDGSRNVQCQDGPGTCWGDNALTKSGMGREGAGLYIKDLNEFGHYYDENGYLGRFVNNVSKVHDLFNAVVGYDWSTGAWISRGPIYDSLFQIYSFAGMIPAAAISGLGNSNNPLLLRTARR